MEKIKDWIKSHFSIRWFQITFILSVFIWIGLAVEFKLFGYSPLKITRYLLLLIVSFFIAWIDGEEHKIPNKILFWLAIGRCAILLAECITYMSMAMVLLISAFMGMISGLLLFGTCYVISRGGMGAGDVKLFMVIGLFLGVNGVSAVAFLSVCAAAVYSLILWIRRRIGMKYTIPFGPFVYIGLIASMFLGI